MLLPISANVRSEMKMTRVISILMRTNWVLFEPRKRGQERCCLIFPRMESNYPVCNFVRNKSKRFHR